jgi:Acyl-CoA reductase (LuxC).
MKNNNVTYIVGNNDILVKPFIPFSDIVCEFLNELSIKLRKDKEASTFSDIMALAFWCRRGNIEKLKEDYSDINKKRIGRGLAFHIAPSNIPINFAFSYFFGLLSGNSNIVRLPSKNFPQVSIICRIINELLKQDDYKIIRDTTSMVTYERNNEITSYYSSICDCRIIWGGDETIRNIRSLPIKERTAEIAFADRYSMCIIDSNAILEASGERLKKLSEQFYNDSYLMDQNACSTPFLVLWYGDKDEKKEMAKSMFWKAVYEYAKKYDLSQIKAVDKYTQLCKNAIEFKSIHSIEKYDNILYVVNINELNLKNEKLRGKFGLFYEHDIENLDNIKGFIDKKIQTLTYFGMDKNELVKFVIDNNLTGIDRIVPIGSSLDMNVIWDGYDIISSLSRIIDIR